MTDSHVPVKKRGGARPLPRPRSIALAAIIFFVGYSVLYIIMWELLPDYQIILNRLSWCMADAVAITGTAMGIYSYYLVHKAQSNADVGYLNEFVFELKRAGIDPGTLSTYLVPVAESMNKMEADPEFKNRVQSALRRISEERLDGLKRLNDEELYELLRSGGGGLL